MKEITGDSIQSIMLSEKLELLEVHNGTILAVSAPDVFYNGPNKPVQLADSSASDYLGIELGQSNTIYKNYAREEYNPEFRGNMGLVKYDRMRKDAAVRAALKVFKTPINGAVWFIEPGEDTKKAKSIAEFVEFSLTQYMTYTWPMVLREALAMVDFGYYFFEKVYKVVEYKGNQRLTYGKLASRHPLDVIEGGWEFDSHGGPVAVNMYNSPGADDHVRIPIEKLVVFPYDSEAGNIYGESLLRSAYKHWFFKEQAYKIDAIQKERHGIGIPIVKLPMGASKTDREYALALAQNLRSNERAGVVLPYGWELLFAKLEGQPVNSLDTANHHAMMIYQNVLAGGILGSEAGASIDAMMEIFYKASRDLANLVRDIVNHYVIKDIVDANWDVTYYPRLCVRRLGDTAEARTISFAIRNLVGAGVLRVDDRLEEWSRSLMDAPMFDQDSYRPAPVPQQGGASANPGSTGPNPMATPKPAPTGPPRQSKANNQKVTPGATSTGRDGGGTGGGTK
ncbi:MAG: DUF935 family protein [Chitinophagaceae bacterium]